MSHFRRATCVALLAVSVSALATDTVAVPKTVAALQHCRGIADAALRVTCYDKAVDALSAATASSEVVIVERGEVRKARKGLFGFTVTGPAFLNGRKDNAEDQADQARLETTIVSSRSLGNDKWRFTVEGGAVWQTVESDSGFDDPKPGLKVLLEKGSLGSFYAKVGRGRRVQAKRVG